MFVSLEKAQWTENDSSYVVLQHSKDLSLSH